MKQSRTMFLKKEAENIALLPTRNTGVLRCFNFTHDVDADKEDLDMLSAFGSRGHFDNRSSASAIRSQGAASRSIVR